MDALAAWPSAITSAPPSLGTRFLVYPQPPFVPGYDRPEVVWLPIAPGRIVAGPESARVYVRDPVLRKDPYAAPYLPPYPGLCHAPAEPGPDGHFDHLRPGTRPFIAAHAFACVHRVLDICESYIGQAVPWFFEPEFSRLELIVQVPWGNAQSGFGFVELGEDSRGSEIFPFALNFDVIAHEVGHLVLFSALGLPRTTGPSTDFLAYHEAASDILSLLGLLHFDTAMDRILRRTRGNLLIMNELDRFAETTDEQQVRRLSHSLRIADVGNDVHDRSRPFSGALFDTLIEIYQVILFERGLTSLDPRSFRSLRKELSRDDLESVLTIAGEAYEIHHFAIKSALAEARDILGDSLMQSWRDLRPDNFSLSQAAEAIAHAARSGRNGRYTDRIVECFAWRGFS